MKCIVWSILGSWLPSALRAAGQSAACTTADVAQLPPHCLAKLKFDPQAAFAPLFGEYRIHLHHYCHGRKWVNGGRLGADRRARLDNLGMAKSKCQCAARAAESCASGCRFCLPDGIQQRWREPFAEPVSP